MKNTSLVLIVVLFIAVAGLYVLHFTGSKSNGSDSIAPDKGATQGLKIAYIKVDSLVNNYDFALEIQDSFIKQQDSYTKKYTDRRSKFENQAAAFEQKVKSGGFLTQERAIQEQNRLQVEQEQIQKLDQEFSSELAKIRDGNNKQLLDSVMNYLKIFNKNNKYNYIFSSAGVLVGDDSHNITKEILVGLNSRFSKAKLK